MWRLVCQLCWVLGSTQTNYCASPRHIETVLYNYTSTQKYKIMCLIWFCVYQILSFPAGRRAQLSKTSIFYALIFKLHFFFPRRQFLPSKPIIHLWNRDANLYLPFRTPQCDDLFCLNIFIFIYVSYSVGLNELLCMWWRNHRTVSSSTIRSNIRFQSKFDLAAVSHIVNVILIPSEQ